MKKIHLDLGARGYDITVGRGLIHRACELLEIRSRAIVVTDSGVPKEYSEAVAKSLGGARIVTLPEGEGSKSLSGFERVLTAMAEEHLTRKDAVVAVGGGVVGDLTGFAAASYMRGIAFYNIPTTVLSMVDSSVGGKCAINLGGIKNIVGAFYQPRGVLIDIDTLLTLDERQTSAGLSESVKMSLTSDAELFSLFEKMSYEEIIACLDDIIIRSVMIKKSVVEADECEAGLRKILNFGHTVGHGIEAAEEMQGIYHGECVALGMIPMCAPSVRDRLIPVLKKLKLPYLYSGDIDTALELMSHDKKADGSCVDAVFVEEVGKYEIKRTSLPELSIAVKASPLIK